MAVNRDRRVKVLIRYESFIKKSMFVSGPATVAGYLLQLEQITRQHYENVLEGFGRASFMRAVDTGLQGLYRH